MYVKRYDIVNVHICQFKYCCKKRDKEGGGRRKKEERKGQKKRKEGKTLRCLFLNDIATYRVLGRE